MHDIRASPLEHYVEAVKCRRYPILLPCRLRAFEIDVAHRDRLDQFWK